MSINQPLTVTVEQAAEVLGVGRSTAYELVRSGNLKCIRLRRRIVVPVAHLAEALGVDRDAVWDTLATETPSSVPSAPTVASAPSAALPRSAPTRQRPIPTVDAPALF